MGNRPRFYRPCVKTRFARLRRFYRQLNLLIKGAIGDGLDLRGKLATDAREHSFGRPV